MQLHFNYGHRSISSLPTNEVLPDFLVITGANGSGKSQLLEALANGSLHGGWDYPSDPVVLLSSTDLGSRPLPSSSGLTRRAIVDQLELQVSQHLRPNGALIPGRANDIYSWLQMSIGLSETAVREAESRAGKQLADWSRPDFEQYAPFENGQSLFEWSVADAFQRYSAMRTGNDFNAWLDARAMPHEPWLTEEQFEAAYGPAPWVLLNEVLNSIGLPYTFVPPTISIEEVAYVPRLESEPEGLMLSPDELSSGEKTLVQIALSVYSGLYRSELSRVPKVLLLDEPDATLHPSMIRSMLRLVEDVLVNTLSMRVFMTTHSPTTVALAPESSLFLMERTGGERLKKASRDGALRRLLVGVPTVSISAEHRRVVFTESPIDASRYTEIFSLLRPNLASERTLSFIPAGGNGVADGCAAVISIVDRLRGNGSIGVWGLVDRDTRSQEPGPWVLFNDERYSIENIVLDPFALGLLLLADGESATVASVPQSTFVRFREVDAQALAESVMERVLPEEARGPMQAISYRDGTSLYQYRTWLDRQGHALEESILAGIPHLRRYDHQHGLLSTVIRRVWSQDVGRIPASVELTFRRLLEAE